MGYLKVVELYIIKLVKRKRNGEMHGIELNDGNETASANRIGPFVHSSPLKSTQPDGGVGKRI